MKITLVPTAGLCNRLNAITSGLAYKNAYPNVDLIILWYKSHECRCRFRDIFKQIPAPYTPVEELTTQLHAIPARRTNLYLPSLIRPFVYDYSFKPGTPADSFDELTKGKQFVYVSAPNRFTQVPTFSSSLATIFYPTDEIQSRIDAITVGWKNVVGIHIRRTDHRLAINKSPMTAFYEAIEKEIKDNNGVTFYVASDDEGVKEDLKGRYGSRIIALPLCLKRNSLQGMKDAVVDLWCLGRTSKIYGSFGSSYSIFASQLYNIELLKVGQS